MCWFLNNKGKYNSEIIGVDQGRRVGSCTAATAPP